MNERRQVDWDTLGRGLQHIGCAIFLLPLTLIIVGICGYALWHMIAG